MNARKTAPKLLWPALALLLLLSACRVEISLEQTPTAPLEQPPPSVVAGDVVQEIAPPPTPPPAPPVGPGSGQAAAPAPSPTPHPSPTPSPTPTAPPVIPALAPPVRIVAPAIGLDAPVVAAGWTAVEDGGAPGSTWLLPDDAAGWHQNSALPGHGSNVVLSGHHNLGAEVFRYLVDLHAGDDIILRADDRDYRYVVAEHFILPERGVPDEQRLQNAQWIMPTVDERLTLVTCWPATDNSHRLIVVARPAG